MMFLKKFIFLIKKFKNHFFFLNTTALKLALESDNIDIFNYLLSLPEIKIVDNCFNSCSKLEKITIPSSVTSIGDFSFYGCDKLTEIIIPSSVTSIGKSFVSGCLSLKRIVIPSTVKHFESFEFKNLSSLTEFNIPSSVTMIYERGFYKCKSLTKVIIPSSVNQICDWAFYQCTSLSSISIPSSITSIGKCAFCDCSSLKEITIPSSIKSIERHAFDGCTSLQKINLPTSLESIGDHAFLNCSKLNKITIPPSVNSIGFNAFKKCFNLVQIPIPSSVDDVKTYSDFVRSSLLEQDYPPIIEQVGDTIRLDYSMYHIKNPEGVKLIILLLGELNVGKESIYDRFFYNKFNQFIVNKYQSIEKVVDVDGNKLKLQIFNTSIFSKYTRELPTTYKRCVCGAVYIFDLTSIPSFAHIPHFISEIEDFKGPVASVLLGNKCELTHQVTCEEIEEFEKEKNIKYIEVSACLGTNIKEAFEYIGKEALYFYLYWQKTRYPVTQVNIEPDDRPDDRSVGWRC